MINLHCLSISFQGYYDETPIIPIPYEENSKVEEIVNQAEESSQLEHPIISEDEVKNEMEENFDDKEESSHLKYPLMFAAGFLIALLPSLMVGYKRLAALSTLVEGHSIHHTCCC